MKTHFRHRALGPNDIDGVFIDCFDVLLPEESDVLTGGQKRDQIAFLNAIERAKEAGTSIFYPGSDQYKEYYGDDVR